MSKENPQAFLTALIPEDNLRKLLLEKQTVIVLKYIRDKLAHDAEAMVTKEEIAKHLDNIGISSRPTTLKLIQRLLDYKVIFDDKPKERENAFSQLKIHPDFEWKTVELDLLIFLVKGLQQHFADFNNETEGVNTVLINDLLTNLAKFTKQSPKSKHSHELTPEPEPIRSKKK